MRKMVVSLVASLVAAAVYAQGFGGGAQGVQRPGRGPNSGIITMLLLDPQVTEELQVTDDQKSKLAEIGGSMGTEMPQIMKDANGDQKKMQKGMMAFFEKMTTKQLAVLSADQNKRLREIFIQDNGVGAIVNKDVQKDLGLKEEQTKKVSDLQDSLMTAMMELGQKMASQEIDFAKFQDLNEKNQKIMKEELAKVLTDDQKKKLKDMEGKPFKRKTGQ